MGSIMSHSTIRSYLHLSPSIAKDVYIDVTATVIGDVRLSEDVAFWPMVVIRGDVNYMSV